jgi:hypothetical protein
LLTTQPGPIPATRDHDPTRLFGKVTNLEPFHPEGLVATIQASNTELGRESVELARDQVLDASIGFQIPHGGEKRLRGLPPAGGRGRAAAETAARVAAGGVYGVLDAVRRDQDRREVL